MSVSRTSERFGPQSSKTTTIHAGRVIYNHQSKLFSLHPHKVLFKYVVRNKAVNKATMLAVLTDCITALFIVTFRLYVLVEGVSLLRKQIACSLAPVNNRGFQQETFWGLFAF